jgi:hypothetical protein
MGDSFKPGKRERAAPALAMAWMPEIGFGGDPALGAVEYHVIHGDREHAFGWTRSKEGKDWLADAEQYFLLGFGIHGPQLSAAPKAGLHAAKGGEFPQFPEKKWDAEFKREAYRPGYFLKRSDWEDLNLDECINGVDPTVALAEVSRFMDQWDQVKECASSEHRSAALAVLPVILAGGISNPWKEKWTYTIELIGRLIEESLHPLAYFKLKFNVARPVVLNKPAQLKVPRHPAFPSGHATQAMLVALVFGSLLKDEERMECMVCAARRVALHRVQAGLHYEMDTNAGFKLAERLTGALSRKAAFRRLVAEAMKEIGTKTGTPPPQTELGLTLLAGTAPVA